MWSQYGTVASSEHGNTMKTCDLLMTFVEAGSSSLNKCYNEPQFFIMSPCNKQATVVYCVE